MILDYCYIIFTVKSTTKILTKLTCTLENVTFIQANWNNSKGNGFTENLFWHLALHFSGKKFTTLKNRNINNQINQQHSSMWFASIFYNSPIVQRHRTSTTSASTSRGATTIEVFQWSKQEKWKQLISITSSSNGNFRGLSQIPKYSKYIHSILTKVLPKEAKWKVNQGLRKYFKYVTKVSCQWIIVAEAIGRNATFLECAFKRRSIPIINKVSRKCCLLLKRTSTIH